ncbi:class I tRNA ligase family protein, partial [Patescibacteria group bacterium]|nr:class I tRNA ligase family protein [Patescibacteria group bacterium]
KKMISWLEKRKLGKKSVNYKLRDWVFSRQHYWGEPMPVVFCPNCKKQLEITNNKSQISNKFSNGEIQNPGWIAVEEKDLPVELPMVEKYQPTETGESPLANIKNWVNTKCPKCGGPAKRETDTMPNWAGSSWYYLAYALQGNPKSQIPNPKYFWDEKRLKYWMPVDLYNGGMEHITLHLLYSRFWYKFLYDIGVVPTDEPYKRRTSHGFVLGEGGVKMSKSKDNVINPDDIVNQYGADALRLYEMFMGPFGERVAWDTKGILGVKRFLDKAWKLFDSNNKKSLSPKLKIKLNQTIKKVTTDIEKMNFNTAVSSMMEFVNEALITRVRPLQISDFLLIFSSFAPHLCEELWQKLGHKDSIIKEKWPKADKRYLIDKEMTIVVQVNGKLRDLIKTKTGIAEKEAIELAKNAPNAKKFIGRNKIKKEIYIKDKLINFVV